MKFALLRARLRFFYILASLVLLASVHPFLYAQTAAEGEPEDSTTMRSALTDDLIKLELFPASMLRSSFGIVPRHRFISGPPQAMAYTNSPAPLGRGYFLPSPQDHAAMLSAAGDLSGKKVLVAGPESGYLAALVSRLAGSVVEIEFLPEKAKQFSDLFSELGYGNIEVRSGKELVSRDSAERYDVILLGYGTETVPLPLVARLSQSGTLVTVLSYRRGEQLLVQYQRVRNGASFTVTGRVFFPGE